MNPEELIIANKKDSLHSEEKAKLLAEIADINLELQFQNSEKEARATELLYLIAKRADELLIANKELVFQNQEKEARAGELVIANVELAFQNSEKEKRADELIVANKELAFQNQEKEARAVELTIANKELEYLNKELETFSYSVSHDLRAPIRAINGFISILEEDYADKFDAEGLRALNSITHNSNRMKVLVEDLLSFAKLGRKEIIVSKIDMMILSKAIGDELIDGAEKKIELDIKDLPPVKGDESLIRQVWVNLISNSIKYSKNKPKTIIEIGAYEEDKVVVYYIKDNGAGFDMNYYYRLFGIFQRLHSDAEFEGTGIGLAIVQKIIHRHGGTVWAKSKLTEGTCFYFSLPLIAD